MANRFGFVEFLESVEHLDPHEAQLVLERLAWRLDAVNTFKDLQEEAPAQSVEAETGEAFAFDDTDVASVWGTEHQCLWARGEPLLVVASPGLGKTTLVQQLLLRRSGVRGGGFLDFPVEVDPGRVLYVAADRPKQAQRSLRRMVDERDRDPLAQSLIVWPGAPPFSISSNPDELLPWVEAFSEVGTVVIDSLKDVAFDLGSDESGSRVNHALQSLVRAGIEVVVLHHDRKSESHRERPRLDDVYGARWITAGAGSVLYLQGKEEGNVRFTLHHLKSPLGPIPKLDLRHDHRRGETTVDNGDFF